MFDGLMNLAGKMIPEEAKADAVYGAIEKIMQVQAKKFELDVSEISANITKTKGVLEVDIWHVKQDGSLDWLGSVTKQELIKILA